MVLVNIHQRENSPPMSRTVQILASLDGQHNQLTEWKIRLALEDDELVFLDECVAACNGTSKRLPEGE